VTCIPVGVPISYVGLPLVGTKYSSENLQRGGQLLVDATEASIRKNGYDIARLKL
jgi:hypothetical protein